MPALVVCSGQEFAGELEIEPILCFMILSWYVPVKVFGTEIISFPRDCCCYICLDRLFLRRLWEYWDAIL